MSNRRRSRSRSPIHMEPKVLTIYNLPSHWDHMKIKTFIKRNIHADRDEKLFIDLIKENGQPTGNCIAKFFHSEVARIAMKELDGMQVDGKKVEVHLMDPKSKHYSNAPPKSNYKPQTMHPKPALTAQNCDTYGLSINFLKSLNITLPLTNKIFVFNLDDQVNEDTIHEVFSMAGHIVTFILSKKSIDQQKKEHMRNTCKIEYDHPVEAVQAIAMFNEQELFDRKMLMRMDYMTTGPLKKFPHGLKNVGQALGANGEPMRNVRQFLELQSIKQEISEKLSGITNNGSNTNANQAMMSSGQMTVGNQMATMGNQMANVGNPMAVTNMAGNQMMNMNSNVNTNAFNSGLGMNTQMLLNQNNANVQAWTGMMPNQMAMIQNQGIPIQGQINNLNAPGMANQAVVNQPMVSQPMMNQGNMMQGHVSNFNSNNAPPQDFGGNGAHSNWSQQSFDRRSGGEGYDKVFVDDNMELTDNRREDDDRRNASNSEMLVFNYLPPTVTLQTLQSKMREIGEVKFVEMTGQGRAIVRFKSPREAEHCIKMYDHSRVDGQLIEVRYF